MIKPSMTLPLIFVGALCMSTITVASTTQNVGKVNLPISCSDGSQQQFNQALALSHHMMYVQAQQIFKDIQQKEPECVMANWGVAFTQIHPLWSDSLSEEEIKNGQALLDKASESEKLSPLERGLIDALSTYYTGKADTDKERFARWEKAQYELYQLHPDQPDTLALYALLHLATAPKSDKTYQHQKEAGELLEELNANFPMHPAGYHYTIHAYDNPALAKNGLYFARSYGKIAPDVPHALHMPTHIFVRLGLWPETISWNIRSAKAALAQPMPDGTTSMHYAHALDYQMYAYLQQQNFKAAKDVLEQVNAIETIQPIFASGYGLAAAKARYYIEQELWREAAQIQADSPASYPWQNFPAALSILYYAKGLGAVHSNDIKTANNMVVELGSLEKQLSDKGDKYWSVLVGAKHDALLAWIYVYEEDNLDTALSMMKNIADDEESVDKHPVTPGELMPAREMYAQLLMRKKQPHEALRQFEKVLEINPNRYKSIKGALEAAQHTSNYQAIELYEDKLADLIGQSDSPD